MTLQTHHERLTLPLESTFSISYDSTDVVETVLIEISDGEATGVGAARRPPLSDDGIEAVAGTVADLLSVVDGYSDPTNLQAIERALVERAPESPGARSGVLIALSDLAGKTLGTPLYRQWGLDPEAVPKTSYTIGLTTPEQTAERTAAAVEAGHDILKVKLSGEPAADRQRIERVRAAAPQATTIRVDANGGYDSEAAIEACEWLAEAEVELFEQPVGPKDTAGLARVHEASSIPIAVDEACFDATSVPAIADRADIVVVKLTKCGGPLGALRQIHTAEAHGLATMLGCMVESNASLAASMHLSPLVDYADLDGSLLLASDPFEGVPLKGGRPALGAVQRDGTGARRR